MVKNPPGNAGDVRDAGLIPGSGRSPGEGNGNPFQYSCLENPMDGGASWATHKESDTTKATYHALCYKDTSNKREEPCMFWSVENCSMGN